MTNPQESSAATARRLVRTAWKATLGTLARDGGHPYASLVAVACEPDGTPLLLLSTLAEHTKNLLADPRASLLFDGTAAGPDALTGARVTLAGRIRTTKSSTARARYLARHAAAAQFVDFGDFAIYALEPEWAHLVAGFGRIVRLAPGELVRSVAGAEAIVAAEHDIVEHMAVDHADAVQLIAARLAGGDPGLDWRLIGCDPDGIDLAAGAAALRLEFPQRITTLEEARSALIALTAAARNGLHAAS